MAAYSFYKILTLSNLPPETDDINTDPDFEPGSSSDEELSGESVDQEREIYRQDEANIQEVSSPVDGSNIQEILEPRQRISRTTHHNGTMSHWLFLGVFALYLVWLAQMTLPRDLIREKMNDGFPSYTSIPLFPQDDLTAAILKNDTARVTKLLTIGANPNRVSNFGFWSLFFFEHPLALATLQNNTIMVQRLLNAGANPNSYGGRGLWGSIGFAHTLSRAVHKNNSEIVEELLKAGANPNAYAGLGPWRSIFFEDCLSLAVSKDNKAIVHALLEAGANPDAYFGIGPWGSFNSHFALNDAIENGQRDILSELFKAGAQKVSIFYHLPFLVIGLPLYVLGCICYCQKLNIAIQQLNRVEM